MLTKILPWNMWTAYGEVVNMAGKWDSWFHSNPMWWKYCCSTQFNDTVRYHSSEINYICGGHLFHHYHVAEFSVDPMVRVHKALMHGRWPWTAAVDRCVFWGEAGCLGYDDRSDW